jgi:anti-sigma factor RsiW
MMYGRPISEEDLHSYVDGALPMARRGEVDQYLKLHPEVAAKVDAYRRQREDLRATLAPIAEEPIPPELNLARMIAARNRPSRAPIWRSAAAAIIILATGGVGGWSFHGMMVSPPIGVAALAQEAAYTYSVYAPDHTHPVQIRATNGADLVNWISGRLHAYVTVPDLSASGFRFMGGSLVATSHGPAGMIMYDNGHGMRLVLLVREMDDNVDMNTPKMLPFTNGHVAGFAWSHNGTGYSLVGAAPPDFLHPLADDVRAQINQTI